MVNDLFIGWERPEAFLWCGRRIWRFSYETKGYVDVEIKIKSLIPFLSFVQI